LCEWMETKEKKNLRNENETKRNVHICAKTPEDAFTVRPNVDRAKKEPSKIKWTSASNVWKFHVHILTLFFLGTGDRHHI